MPENRNYLGGKTLAFEEIKESGLFSKIEMILQ